MTPAETLPSRLRFCVRNHARPCLLVPFLLALLLPLTVTALGGTPRKGQLRFRADVDSFETTGAFRWTIHITAGPGEGAPVTLHPAVELRGVACAAVVPDKAVASPDAPAHFRVETDDWKPGQPLPSISIGLPGIPGGQWNSPLPFVLDLTGENWDVSAGADTGKSSATGSEIPKVVRLPMAMKVMGSFELGRQFTVPLAWRGLPAWFVSGPIDDADVTSVNGREVGRGSGWDRPRAYRIPDGLLRYGASNEVRVRVNNLYPPVGGVLGRPVEIRFGDPLSSTSLLADTGIQDEATRRAPGSIGAAQPRRPLRVVDGVLRFADGDEAALWGVNYIPATWVSRTGESLHDDPSSWRASMDEDLEELKRWGVDLIRVSVFDGNFVRPDGSIEEGVFLDTLDHLVDRCNKAGFYLHLTPLTSIKTDGPGNHTLVRSKGGSVLNAAEWPAQERTLRELMTRRNPRTGRRLADEPCLALVELVNEPHGYWTLDEVRAGLNDSTRFAVPPDVSERSMKSLARDWDAFVPAHGQTPAAYAHFTYARVLGYINTMSRVLRECGVTAPLFYHADGPPEIRKAIADSRIDGIAIWAYPGELTTTTDHLNLLGQVGNAPLDAVYADKARIAYEFDAGGQVRGCSMFPPIARHLRSRGAQAACQFQYDPLAIAAPNRAWPQHYLNVFHTPERWVSFLIGGDLFRRLPRGVDAGGCAEDCVFDGVATSFARNGVRLSHDGVFMSAGAPGWEPVSPPANPTRILVSGSSPLLGTATRCIAALTISAGTSRLVLTPAVTTLRDGFMGTPESPLTQLRDDVGTVTLALPGMRAVRVWRLDRDRRTPVAVRDSGIPGRAGEYEIEWEKTGK